MKKRFGKMTGWAMMIACAWMGPLLHSVDEVTWAKNLIMDEEYAFLFKTLLVGDTQTGKSNLLSRIKGDPFLLESKPTVGVDFTTQGCQYRNQGIKLQVWDTGGEEKFRAIVMSYFRGAKGGLLVFDVTNRGSFDHLEMWAKLMAQYASEESVWLLVANKIDVEESDRVVSRAEGEEKAEVLGMRYMEVSAKENTNVDEVFFTLVRDIMRGNPNPEWRYSGGRGARPWWNRPGPKPKDSTCTLL